MFCWELNVLLEEGKWEGYVDYNSTKRETWKTDPSRTKIMIKKKPLQIFI